MKIGYHNILTAVTSTITASTEATGGEKENAYSYRESDFWTPTAVPAWLKSTDSGTATVDYFCMYAHDFTGTGSVVLQWSDNDSTWNDAFTVLTPTDNTPVFETFTSSAHKYWRVYITGGVQSIGIISYGVRLDMPFELSVGYKPLSLSQTRTPKHNISATGLYIGRSLQTVPLVGTLTFPSYFTETWMRTEWLTLLAHMEQYPFFVMPQDSYTDEVAFCWTNKIATPGYSTQTHLGLSLKVMAKRT